MTVAAFKFGCVIVECFSDSDRPIAIDIAATRNGACLVLGLPKSQNVRAVAILKIVGDAVCLDPMAAVTVSNFGAPTPRAFVAAIALGDSWRDGDVIGLAPYRQLESGGAGFKLR